MQEFMQFVTSYWPDILSYFGIGICYFLVLLYKYSTRNLNGNLKTIFTEDTGKVIMMNKQFEKNMQIMLEQAELKYKEAVEMCEEYQKKVTHLEETLKDFLDGGDQNG